MEKGGGVMLISFTMENTFSFRDKNTLDMRASGVKAHSYSLINEGEHKLLPVTAVYGANASGKTNLIRILEAAFSFIAGDKIIIRPFLFGQIKEKNVVPSYTLNFIVKTDYDMTECEFSFAALGNGLYYEELKYIPPAKKKLLKIYSRKWDSENNGWELAKGASESARLFLKEIEYVNEMETAQDSLFLTALGKRARFPLFKNILQWVLRASLYDEPFTSKIGRPLFDKDDEFVAFINNESDSQTLNSFVHMINPIIRGITLKERKNENSLLVPVFDYEISTFIPNINNEITIYESKGVWTAILLYPRIHHVLTNGGLLIIDELENSLHPLLMAKIVSLFTSPETNPGHGQLIFTTHNALLMDKKNFRQDEIVFVEKDETGASSIYRLSDIEGVRSDLDFCKNYIMGAFGAVPNLSESERDDA